MNYSHINKKHNASNRKVLVLGGDSRNGLAIVRSLGKIGYYCSIVSFKDKRFYRAVTKVFRSKYSVNFYYVPQHLGNDEKLLCLLDVIKTEKYSFLFCAGTDATNFASKNQKKLKPYIEPLVEDYEKIWKIHEKSRCLKWAAEQNIPTPKSYVIKNLDDLKRAVNNIDYPVIIKPVDSSASKGIWLYPEGGLKLYEEYLKRLPDAGNDITKPSNHHVIQERISGSLVDTTAFSIDGKPYQVLSQSRIVTSWLDGGGGVVNVTNNIPIIKEYTEKIIKELCWTGPILLDWIQDERDGSYKLLEINPKFWGTTQLTISSGCDFPKWYIQYVSENKLPDSSGYTQDLMYRWIFSEIYTVLILPKNLKRFKEELKDFINRFSHKPSKFDIYITDIKPSIAELIFLMIKIFKHGAIFKQFYRMILKK